MTSTMTRAAIAEKPSAPSSGAAWHLPVGLGIFGFLAAFAGSWVPSFWGDEAASVVSAERSLASLFGMLKNVDAVHGLYYVFLHFWIQAFGASETSVRIPSAIAVGIMVAGTFVLGRMLAGRNAGIVAALICAVLPRTSYMGADARSYALSSATAVWGTVLLVVLLRHRFGSRLARRLAWAGYAATLALGIYLFLYLGLLLLVHGAFLLSDREQRGNYREWLKAAGCSVALALPIAGFGYVQRGQIAFLTHRGYATAKSVLVTQWFGNPFLATTAWSLIALAIIGTVVAWRHAHTASPLGRLGILWTIVPTVAVLVLNVVTPAYNLRYPAFCIPGVALAVTAGIWVLPHRLLRVAAVIVLVACALPTDVAQRGPFAKDGGSDLAQSADVISRLAKPGDGIVFDRTTANRQRPRLALHLYPNKFTGLRDVALKTPYLDRPQLWDETYPLGDVTSRLATIHRVWVVELNGSPDDVNGTDIHTLESDAYTLVSTRLVHRTVIYSLVKEQPRPSH